MSLGTARRADTVNRTVLSTLGSVGVLVGALGLALSLGAFGKSRSSKPIVDSDIADRLYSNGKWLWIVALAASIILAYLFLRWLFFQLKPRPAAGGFTFPAREGRGETQLPASAVEQAVVKDLQEEPGVRKAGARLRQHSDPLIIDAWVEYDTASYVPAFRQRVEQQVVSRLREALEVDEAVVTLEIRPVSGVLPRVR